MTRTSGQRGMTLLEITVAIAILASVVALMYGVIERTVTGQRIAQEGLRQPKISNAVMTQIWRDFRYLWWGGLKNDVGFLGTKTAVGSRVDFITARPTRLVGSEDDGGVKRDERQSPLTEVGYAVRRADRGDYIELWRREDYFVDADPLKGGKYHLVYDRLKKFEISYFPIPEESRDDKGLEEWDSRLKHGVPYAVMISLRLDVEGETADYADEGHPIVSIILLREAYAVSDVPPDERAAAR